MEIIEQILRAEKQAAQIKREAEESAERILRNAEAGAEATARFGKRSLKGSEREYLEKLASKKQDWESRAETDAAARRAGAESRVEPAAAFVVREILKGAGV